MRQQAHPPCARSRHFVGHASRRPTRKGAKDRLPSSRLRSLAFQHYAPSKFDVTYNFLRAHAPASGHGLLQPIFEPTIFHMFTRRFGTVSVLFRGRFRAVSRPHVTATQRPCDIPAPARSIPPRRRRRRNGAVGRGGPFVAATLRSQFDKRRQKFHASQPRNALRPRRDPGPDGRQRTDRRAGRRVVTRPAGARIEGGGESRRREEHAWVGGSVATRAWKHFWGRTSCPARSPTRSGPIRSFRN